MQPLGRVALVVSLLAPLAAAQDWPGFRGPGGAGRGEAELPGTFTAADFAWRVELPGPGHSSPAVAGERIFLTCVEPDGGALLVVCLATADGAERWVHARPFEPRGQHRLNSHAAASPAVDAQHVYVLVMDAGVLLASAFDHEGERVWERAVGASEAQHGFGSSPLVVDGTLIVANDNEEASSALVGLDAATGELRWRRERSSERASYSTPVLHHRADGALEVLFASTAHGLTALDPETGALRWERDDLFDQRTVGTPVVAGDLALVFAGQGGGGQESAAVELEGGTPDEPPAVRYRLRRALPYVPTPAFHDGMLFLWSDGGVVSCVDAATGEPVWQERVGGDFYASAVVVGDLLLAPSNAGELVVLRAAPEYEPVHRLDLGESTQATPAAAGGVLYLRTLTHLIAVGKTGE